MDIQQVTGGQTLFECPVILNPKSMWQWKPNARLAIRRDGVWFSAEPPGLIPYNTIRSAKVRQFTDGVIEHDGQQTKFQLTGSLAMGQVGRLVSVIDELCNKGFEGITAETIKKQLQGLHNYWICFLTAIVLTSSGGAIGGASGAIAGFWSQSLVNRRPNMPVWAKAGIVIVGIVVSFILYTASLAILMIIFPGFRDLLTRK